MPSRAYTSFLPLEWVKLYAPAIACQCPHGLMPHFYLKRSDFLKRFLIVCQCPLGLVPHFYRKSFADNDPSTIICQCPHGLVPHFYWIFRDIIKSTDSFVSMPSRASTSFLRGLQPHLLFRG